MFSSGAASSTSLTYAYSSSSFASSLHYQPKSHPNHPKQPLLDSQIGQTQIKKWGLENTQMRNWGRNVESEEKRGPLFWVDSVG